MASYQTRERQKRREYRRLREREKEREAEEIRAVGMLLDAVWIPENKVFLKRGYNEKTGQSWYCYYNRKGETLTRMDAEKWR